MRKVSHQFGIVFFINEFLCHSAMYKFKAGENISENIRFTMEKEMDKKKPFWMF